MRARKENVVSIRAINKNALFTIITALFLLITVPVSAHNMPIGGSYWCVGKNNIVAVIDLNSALFADIRGLKEGHYNVESSSDKELQQIATDIIQPYINNKLSIAVNDKVFPVKVTRLNRTDNNLFKIWLSVNNIPINYNPHTININYNLLFEETNNTHVNLAYVYLSDATADTVQKIFDFSQPAMQNTFDHKAREWNLSIKGTAHGPEAEHKVVGPAADGSAANGIKTGIVPAAAKKNSADRLLADKITKSKGQGETLKNLSVTSKSAALLPERTQNMQKSQNSGYLSAQNQLVTSPSESRINRSISDNPVTKSLLSTIGEFILLGIEHILSGYDHIAFLLALIIIGLSIKEVLKIITAFTIAHSLTLLLATLQLVRLNSRFVESVIALSICYVALENLFRKKVNYRWLVTFGFGLIHGFGFASALQELIVGKSNLLVSLLSFNIGVETGQLMIFFVMLPALYLLKNKAHFRVVTTGTSVAIFTMGFAWFVERLFDLKLMPF